MERDSAVPGLANIECCSPTFRNRLIPESRHRIPGCGRTVLCQLTDIYWPTIPVKTLVVIIGSIITNCEQRKLTKNILESGALGETRVVRLPR